jgi:parallel beta-helix repeat protein
MNKPSSCIQEAEKLLNESPNDPDAYMWLALAHKMEETNATSMMADGLMNDMSGVFGAISMHFSSNDFNIAKTLNRRNIATSSLREVVRINSSEDLEKVVDMNRIFKIKLILLVSPGAYSVPQLWLETLDNVFVVGEMSGPKPTFVLSCHTRHISFRNVFINIHFKLEHSQLTLNLLKDPVLFFQCSFQSKSPRAARDSDEYNKAWEEHMEKIQEFRSLSPEELEKRTITKEERATNAKLDMKLNGWNVDPACPAVALIKGLCVMINCEFFDCMGAGALVVQDDQSRESHLYMKGCTMRNCGCAGAEAREKGNLILDNCSITESRQGVLIWISARTAVIRGCDINNNKGEGILMSDSNLLYDNPMRLILEGSHIHHNQIGVSLSHVRSVDVRNNQIFSNRSWGIFLRNSNVTIIQQNNIFRNDCGGIRVCLNRFEETVVMKNQIHDHTGPDLLQTVFFSESQNKQVSDHNKQIRKWWETGCLLVNGTLVGPTKDRHVLARRHLQLIGTRQRHIKK